MNVTVAQFWVLVVVSISLLGPLSLPASAELMVEEDENTCTIQEGSEATLPERDPGDYVLAIQETGELRAGNPTLEDGTLYNIYLILGVAGQEIEVQLHSQAFRPALLVMYAETEDLVRTADGDETGSIREVLTLPEDGLYIIWVKSMEVGETGAYELSVGVAR
jgi:hypothetical protein